jgi:hypothetical protein
MAKRGSRPAPPFDFACYGTIAGVNSDDGGDGVYCAGDDADHAKKLDWMIVPSHCWPLKNEPIAIAEWFRAQMQQ